MQNRVLKFHKRLKCLGNPETTRERECYAGLGSVNAAPDKGAPNVVVKISVCSGRGNYYKLNF